MNKKSHDCKVGEKSYHSRHDYKGNRNLDFGTNQDFMENKILVCGTDHGYKRRNKKIGTIEQITTTKRRNIKFDIVEQITTTKKEQKI
jgi:hypothetical protein